MLTAYPFIKLAFFLAFLLVLVGCEADATPIAFQASPSPETQQISPSATNPAALRYGIFENALGYITEISEIQARANVENFSDIAQANDYDIVIAFGQIEGWEVSELRQTVSFALNSNLAPLDNEIIRQLIPLAIDSNALVAEIGLNGVLPISRNNPPNTEIRNQLANLGYPDGLNLTIASEAIFGLELTLNQLYRSNIRLQLIDLATDSFSQNEAHLFAFVWTNPDEHSQWLAQVGETNVFDLYSFPLSYRIKEGIQVEFSENGLPLPAR